MMNRFNFFKVCFLGILLLQGSVFGEQNIEELFSHHFSNNGSSLVSGQARILREVRSPIYNTKDLFPDLSEEMLNGKKFKSYISSLKTKNSLNMGDNSEHSYEALSVYYNETSKRKDVAGLDEGQFLKTLADDSDFSTLPFEKYFGVGGKVTGFNDQKGVDKLDPIVMIKTAELGIPNMHQWGRFGATSDETDWFLKELKGERFVLSGYETEEGYVAVATAEIGFIKKIELLLDANHDNRTLSERTYDTLGLIEEKLYSDFKQTPSGDWVPYTIKNKRFAPNFTDIAVPLLTFEEHISVLEVDYNLEIPDEIFVPVIPSDYTVVDFTVSPPSEHSPPVHPQALAQYNPTEDLVVLEDVTMPEASETNLTSDVTQEKANPQRNYLRELATIGVAMLVLIITFFGIRKFIKKG